MTKNYAESIAKIRGNRKVVVNGSLAGRKNVLKKGRGSMEPEHVVPTSDQVRYLTEFSIEPLPTQTETAWLVRMLWEGGPGINGYFPAWRANIYSDVCRKWKGKLVYAPRNDLGGRGRVEYIYPEDPRTRWRAIYENRPLQDPFIACVTWANGTVSRHHLDELTLAEA